MPAISPACSLLFAPSFARPPSNSSLSIQYNPSIYPSIRPSVHPFIHPSIHSSINPSIHLAECIPATFILRTCDDDCRPVQWAFFYNLSPLISVQAGRSLLHSLPSISPFDFSAGKQIYAFLCLQSLPFDLHSDRSIYASFPAPISPLWLPRRDRSELHSLPPISSL